MFNLDSIGFELAKWPVEAFVVIIMIIIYALLLIVCFFILFVDIQFFSQTLFFYSYSIYILCLKLNQVLKVFAFTCCFSTCFFYYVCSFQFCCLFVCQLDLSSCIVWYCVAIIEVINLNNGWRRYDDTCWLKSIHCFFDQTWLTNLSLFH